MYKPIPQTPKVFVIIRSSWNHSKDQACFTFTSNFRAQLPNWEQADGRKQMVQLYLPRINKKKETCATLEAVQNTQRAGQQDGSPLNKPQPNSPKHPQSVSKRRPWRRSPACWKIRWSIQRKSTPTPTFCSPTPRGTCLTIPKHRDWDDTRHGLQLYVCWRTNYGPEWKNITTISAISPGSGWIPRRPRTNDPERLGRGMSSL